VRGGFAVGLVSRLVWVFAFVALAIGGCNDVYTPAPLNLTIAGTDGSSDPWIHWPLEGVQVCEGVTEENCEMSDASGQVTIDLPVGQIFYTLKKEGYDSVLIAQVHPEGGRTMLGGVSMWKNELRAAFYEFYESAYPRRGTGEIHMWVKPYPFPGATFDLVDATGKQYYDAENPLDAAATAHWGAGGFLEVTPGTFQVKYGGTAENCALDWGWPSGENSLRVPVLEDHVSVVILLCRRP